VNSFDCCDMEKLLGSVIIHQRTVMLGRFHFRRQAHGLSCDFVQGGLRKIGTIRDAMDSIRKLLKVDF
jgi:hypothetical protein